MATDFETVTVRLDGMKTAIGGAMQEEVDRLKEEAARLEEETSRLKARIAMLEEPRYSSGYLKGRFGGERIVVTATPRTFTNVVMCRNCNQPMAKNTTMMLASDPPMYEYRCGRCGCITYRTY